MVYLSFLEYLICFYHKVKVYFLSVLTVAIKRISISKAYFLWKLVKIKLYSEEICYVILLLGLLFSYNEIYFVITNYCPYELYTLHT